MSKRSDGIEAKDVVDGAVDGELIFIERARAHELVATQDALWSAATWGELKVRMPAAEYADLFRWSGAEDLPDFRRFYREERKGRPGLRRADAMAEYRALSPSERRPEPDDSFDPRSIGAVSDGDIPGWPAQEMLGWVPKDIQERWGKRELSFINGERLTFEPEREPQVVEAFMAHGYRCVRDDALVRRASGYAS